MEASKRQSRARRKAQDVRLERAEKRRVNGEVKKLSRNPTPEFLEERQAEMQKKQNEYVNKVFAKHLRRLARFHLPETQIKQIMSQPILVRQKVIVRMNQTSMNNKYFGGVNCTRQQEMARRVANGQA